VKERKPGAGHSKVTSGLGMSDVHRADGPEGIEGVQARLKALDAVADRGRRADDDFINGKPALHQIRGRAQINLHAGAELSIHDLERHGVVTPGMVPKRDRDPLFLDVLGRFAQAYHYCTELASGVVDT
jgi:hypothetical protein